MDDSVHQVSSEKPARDEKALRPYTNTTLVIQFAKDGISNLQNALWDTSSAGLIVDDLKQALDRLVKEFVGSDGILGAPRWWLTLSCGVFLGLLQQKLTILQSLHQIQLQIGFPGPLSHTSPYVQDRLDESVRSCSILFDHLGACSGPNISTTQIFSRVRS